MTAPMATGIFKSTTAFFSPLIPPATRARFCFNGGTIPTEEHVIRGAVIDVFIGVQGRDDPLVQRIRALGIRVYDVRWMSACLANGKWLDPCPFLVTDDGSTFQEPSTASRPFSSLGLNFDLDDESSPNAPLVATKKFQFTPSPLSQVTTLPHLPFSSPPSYFTHSSSVRSRSEEATLDPNSPPRQLLSSERDDENNGSVHSEFHHWKRFRFGEETGDDLCGGSKFEIEDEWEEEEGEGEAQDSAFFEVEHSQLLQYSIRTKRPREDISSPRSGSPDLPPWTEIEIDSERGGVEILSEVGIGALIEGEDDGVVIKEEEVEEEIGFESAASSLVPLVEHNFTSTSPSSSIPTDSPSPQILPPESFYTSLLSNPNSTASESSVIPTFDISSLLAKVSSYPLSQLSDRTKQTYDLNQMSNMAEEGMLQGEHPSRWSSILRSGMRNLKNGEEGFEATRKRKKL